MTPTTVERAHPAFHPDPGLLESSAALIARLQDPSGAYPASPTFSAYAGYCWFRDGAFIAEAMRVVGRTGSADAFHAWCARVLVEHDAHITSIVAASRRGDIVPASEMLPTRYRLDGSVGDDEWWDFQLDGYGTWLWALARRWQGSTLEDADLRRAVALAARYVTEFWHLPCYDWWEEHSEARHTSTLAALRAGLASALDEPALSACLTDEDRVRARAALQGIDATIAAAGTRPDADRPHLVKWLGSVEVDASLLSAIGVFDLPLPDPVREATLEAVEAQLAHRGGVHRFRADTYFGGGRWLLLSGFLALAHVRAGHPDRAVPYLRWIEEHADADGRMPEQVNDVLLHPDRYAEWEQRWGTPAYPLLWSNAMYLLASHAYTGSARSVGEVAVP